MDQKVRWGYAAGGIRRSPYVHQTCTAAKMVEVQCAARAESEHVTLLIEIRAWTCLFRDFVSGVPRSATLMTLFLAVLMVRWALVGLNSPGQRPETGDCDTPRPYFGALGWAEESSKVCLHALAGCQHLASLPIRTRSRELR